MAYVTFDPETQALRVEIPPEQEHLATALRHDLSEAFWGEPENLQTALRMEAFIARWFSEQKEEV